MSCLTFYASELGSLLDMSDTRLTDVLTDLWDGFDRAWKKATATMGTDVAVNPWINFFACTTPSWLSENVRRSATEGGLFSRIVAVYANQKRQLIAYPRRHIQQKVNIAQLDKLKQDIIHDLCLIAEISGPFELTEEAYDWGAAWYEEFQSNPPQNMLQGMFDGYISRKQGHVHKLAMVLSVAKRDDRIIDKPTLEAAVNLMADVESRMENTFQYVGKSSESSSIDDLVKVMKARRRLPSASLYRLLFQRNAMPRNEYINALQSAVAAGVLREEISEGLTMLVYVEDKQ